VDEEVGPWDLEGWEGLKVVVERGTADEDAKTHDCECESNCIRTLNVRFF